MVVNEKPLELIDYSVGRKFSNNFKVRLGDVDVNGALRLDALTRYAQDVSDDDTEDVDLIVSVDTYRWVVRSTTVKVIEPAKYHDLMVLKTFCASLGSCSAERRIDVTVGEKLCYKISTSWAFVNNETGMPTRLPQSFVDVYSEAAAGNKLRSRNTIGKLNDVEHDTIVEEWQLRSIDFDVFGHVNNASYWSVVEEELHSRKYDSSYLAKIEYMGGVPHMNSIDIAKCVQDGKTNLWWIKDGETLAAAELLFD